MTFETGKFKACPNPIIGAINNNSNSFFIVLFLVIKNIEQAILFYNLCFQEECGKHLHFPHSLSIGLNI